MLPAVRITWDDGSVGLRGRDTFRVGYLEESRSDSLDVSDKASRESVKLVQCSHLMSVWGVCEQFSMLTITSAICILSTSLLSWLVVVPQSYWISLEGALRDFSEGNKKSRLSEWAQVLDPNFKTHDQVVSLCGNTSRLDQPSRSLFPPGFSLQWNGNPFQYSCLENPMDGGAWWATVHGVAKRLHFTSMIIMGSWTV